MINKKEKKGLSEVVSTVLVIVLSVAAVGMLAGFVVPYVNKNLKDGTACVGFEDYIAFKESVDYRDKQYFLNCKYRNSSLERIGLIVRGPEEESDKINGFYIILSDSDKISDSKKMNEETTDFYYLGENKSGGYIVIESGEFEMPGQGAYRTYILNDTNKIRNYTHASLAIISGEDSSCQLSAKIELKECPTNMTFNTQGEINSCILSCSNKKAESFCVSSGVPQQFLPNCISGTSGTYTQNCTTECTTEI